MNGISISREAFMLLAKMCKVSEEKLILAFERISERNIFYKKKRSGGKRIIVASHPDEYLVQKKILRKFLDRMLKRQMFHERTVWDHYLRMWVKLPVLHHGQPEFFDNELHGSRLKKSVATALEVHNKPHQFLLRIDLKDAFGSVGREYLRVMLYEILLKECEAYYKAYAFRLQTRYLQEGLEELMRHMRGFPPTIKKLSAREDDNYEALQTWMSQALEVVDLMGWSFAITSGDIRNMAYFHEVPSNVSPRTIKRVYPKHPFFSANSCVELRRMIREAVLRGAPLLETSVPSILKAFTDYMLHLVTHDGSLPQGSPTSGALLNLVVTKTGMIDKLREALRNMGGGNVVISAYVDDIIITLSKKPNKEVVDPLVKIVEDPGIFRCNRKKIRTYDLRNGGALVLGARLVQLPVTAETAITLEARGLWDQRSLPLRYVRSVRKGRPWMITVPTLPKKKQKQYRGFLHRLTVKGGTEKEIAIGNGYHGHIVLTYGWPMMHMPASLRNVVHEFRTKYHTPPLERKQRNNGRPSHIIET